MKPASDAEASAELIRRLYKELFWEWDLTSIDKWFSPEFRSSEMPPGIPSGPEGVRQFYAAIRSSFPDLQYSVEDVIAQGDKVVVRWRWIATHAPQVSRSGAHRPRGITHGNCHLQGRGRESCSALGRGQRPQPSAGSRRRGARTPMTSVPGPKQSTVRRTSGWSGPACTRWV